MCSICVREEAEREAERQKQLEQRKLQEEEERQRRYREWLAQIRLPKFLKTVDPEEFEKLICRLFSQMGYRVEPTPYVGDNGSDGYIFKNGKKTVIQCKRVQGSVGEPVIRDLYGTMHATQCDDAIVVTTGKVSKQARAWIDGKPIRIIEIDELQGMLVRHFKESDIVPKSFTVSGWLDLCPRCGKNLRIVKGRWGKFIGCTGYPGCRFTRRHLEPKSPSKPAT
jgi:restriction system protein